VTTLHQQLGLTEGSKGVLFTGDDLGLCHAANTAVFSQLQAGALSGASLIVPAPWAREAIVAYRGEPISVQLTATAEHLLYCWGPITAAPSLHGGDGGFASSVVDLLDHADGDDLRREFRAQIERAVLWGFDVCGLTVHQDAALLRPEYFDVVLDLAVEFDLPLRLAERPDEELGFPATELATEEGICSPDRTVRVSGDLTIEAALAALEPGLTEIIVRPADDTGELRALAADAEARIRDHEALQDLHLGSGVTVVSWRDVRTAQRALRANAS
jgi:predicted glycoside hydrolase/deacetylase ChbG (UPF0249 family)